MEERLYLSPPYICGNEQKYVAQAFEQNWIAPLGPNVTALEKAIAQHCDMPFAVACDSGTSAMHLALRALNVEQGDYVFCSDFTFAASCNPILYQKANPVFIDSELTTWNMSPEALEYALADFQKKNKLPKAVIIVDLYGISADYDALLPICQKYNVPVIEDSAEALGTYYNQKPCGQFGDITIFSFNGNKIVTTSGGGMLLSHKEEIAEKALFWATQAREKVPYYEHKEYGYNYRLSNVSAGIGLGQLEMLQHKIQKRKEIFTRYQSAFANTGITMMPENANQSMNYWLSCILLPHYVTPLDVWKALEDANIESRPLWKPMHMQPLYQEASFCTHQAEEPVSEYLFSHGLCLPSGEAMTKEQQQEVINIVLKSIS